LTDASFVALGGSLLGIAFRFVTRLILVKIVPAALPQAIVPQWWPIAGGIAVGASLLGALYPGTIAALQDPIEALSVE
jgi:ABC-type antimicrobial peptide transport system permease subunit